MNRVDGEMRKEQLAGSTRKGEMMRPIVWYMILFAAFAVLAGCEWEAYNSDTSWTDSGYSWINLSGGYRAKTSGSMMVVDPAYSGGTGGGGGSGGTGGSTNTEIELSDDIIVSDGAMTVLSGGCAYYPIVPGTLTVVGAGYSFVDSGVSNLVGTAGTSGTVEYETGKVTLDFKGVAPDANEHFIAAYVWVKDVTTGDSGSTGSTTTNLAAQGNSGTPIYVMFVEQQGNRLTVSDSNGDRYDGILITVRSTTGAGAVGGNGTIIAQYQLTGQGKKSNVTIEGAFLGEYTIVQEMSLQEQLIRQRLGQQLNASSGSTAILINRTMTGTWLEHDAAGNVIKAGDLIGVADIQSGSQSAPADNNSGLSNIVIQF